MKLKERRSRFNLSPYFECVDGYKLLEGDDQFEKRKKRNRRVNDFELMAKQVDLRR